jgi:hypothetical protein
MVRTRPLPAWPTEVSVTRLDAGGAGPGAQTSRISISLGISSAGLSRIQ